MATKTWAILVIILATVLTSTGQLLYKLGSPGFTLESLLSNYYLIAGFIVYLTAGILMIVSFKGGELSVLYPFIALSFVWVSIFSTYFLNEMISIVKWIGIAVIIIGISAIGIGSSKQGIAHEN